MKRALRNLGIVAGVLLVLAGGLVWLAWRELSVPQLITAPVTVEVPSGATVRQVADLLEEAGLVRWPGTFEAYVRLSRQAPGLKAGRYTFSGRLSPRAVLSRLLQGAPRPDVRVTLPEGLNRWEVAKRLEDAGVCPAKAFLDLVGRRSLEGRLFPDTYRFFPGSSPERVAKVLTERFDSVWARLRSSHAAGLAGAKAAGLSERDLIVLASLVEKEAKVAAERPVIARVFFNRLAKKWKLQTDPTCVYGRTTHQEVPSPKRCRDPNNRYSTYVHTGLPPGPIANPGRASLKAVLAPAATPEAAKLMFFVARRDGTGRHDFSVTDKEHRAKVRRYLRGGK